MTPLMHAAASGQAELVQFLVDINRVSWDEELQFRVTRLDTELPSDTDFKALHFDVAAAAQDREGETALMKAAACGDAESATALLGSASNEEARDRKGRTALMHALARKQAAFLQAMIEGAETALRHTPPGYTVTGFVTPEVLCAVDEVGKTALDLARAQGDAQIAAGLQAYLEHVIELETRGIESGSPYAGYCYQVRGLARKALGQTVEAEADLAKSRELSKPGP
jgi:ankyrin repeat protein